MLRNILLSGILLFSFAQNSLATIKGFWFDPSALVIMELTDNKAILSTYNSYKEQQYVIDYEIIDDTRIHFKSNKIKISTIAAIEEDGTLTLNKLKGVKGRMKFIRPIIVPKEKILGTWLTNSIGGDLEYSLIIRQKEGRYDSEFIQIDHSEKTYTKDFILDIESHFKYGFMFYEPALDNPIKDPNVEVLDNYYFITQYDNDSMTLQDLDGYSWIQKRTINPKHVNIPKNYTLAINE